MKTIKRQQITTTYEFPENDPLFDNDEVLATKLEKTQQPLMRSNLLQNLLVCMNLEEYIKVISDIAFDSLDDDGSGQLDEEEIATIMKEVANQMGVTPPTDEDLKTILWQLDEDFDGQVSKDEFNKLVMLVIGKLLESEQELQEKTNQDIVKTYQKQLEKEQEEEM